MAKSANQKMKLLYLMRMLEEESDEQHPLTMSYILARLEAMGVEAERKSIYDDLDTLRFFGMDIIKQTAKPQGYFLASREFEMPELKLLVDAVQSSKFITARKSSELIKKVENLSSRHQAGLLQRQVYVANRIKTMNESIYYNVDALHNAIAAESQITFRYFEWVVDFTGGEKVKSRFRKEGALYQISPWALAWEDENYYLVGYDSVSQKIKHYRVDKMTEIRQNAKPRDGQQEFRNFDMGVYSRGLFGMFGGKEETVRLRMENRLIGVVADRFGRQLKLLPAGEGFFEVWVSVNVSPQFFSWLFGFEEKVQILSPLWVREEYCRALERVSGVYAQTPPEKEPQKETSQTGGKDG